MNKFIYNRIKDNLRILIACEESQVVCSTFRKLGFHAYSNDINKCYGGKPRWHIIGDAAKVVQGHDAFETESGDVVIIENQWDMIIAHPPCTMITHSSAVALSKGIHTIEDVRQGAEFFMKMLNAPCDYIAVENPAPMKIANLPKYNQIIQPYNFGERFSKRVCLWLKNLPPILPTRGYSTDHREWLKHCSSTHRRRSKTFEGVAEAMAINWGDWLVKEKMKTLIG